MLIVGPDGSGKSTLAFALIDATRPLFTETIHMHWRPGLLPRPGAIVGVEPGDPTDPHARPPHGLVVSLGLLLYHWADFFLGSWLRIVPARACGALIVMERGWMDIGVDPRRYHLRIPQRLVELLGHLLPAPDLVVLLRADATVLADRKAELPVGELERQLGRWRQVRFPRSTRTLVLDASRSQHDLLTELTQVLRSR
jgi:hypothetical protein